MYEPGVHINPDGIAYRYKQWFCHTRTKAIAFHPGYKTLIDEFNKAAYEY
jgi:hypothetical protein